jgi:hypothetical protein
MNAISKEWLDNMTERFDWKEWSMGLLEQRDVYFFDFNTDSQYFEFHFSTYSMLMKWLEGTKSGASPEAIYENMVD